MDSSDNLPEVCKTCVIKSICTKDRFAGTLCDEAHNELRQIIFSFKEKDKGE